MYLKTIYMESELKLLELTESLRDLEKKLWEQLKEHQNQFGVDHAYTKIARSYWAPIYQICIDNKIVER